MKTFHKLLSAGAITALSFSAALVAQERQTQSGQPSSQVQERSEQQTPQVGQRSQQQTPQAGEQSEGLDKALERAQKQQQEQQQFGARAEQNHKATDLKGSKLNTRSGESLGEVEDIAINLENGELAYLLVGAEGGEWKPVPPQAVNIQKTGQEIELTVDIEKQKWEQVETISKEEVAQLSQEQRAREIYQTFGEDYQQHKQQQQQQFGSPDRQGQQSQQDQEQSSQSHLPEARSSEQSQSSQSQEFGQQQQPRPGERAGQQTPRPGERVGQQSQRPGERIGQQSQSSGIQSRQQQQQQGQASLGSKLMEAKIQNQQQEEIGEITDLILNVEESRIEFVLIEPQEQEGTFAVSPQAFQRSGEDQVRLNVSEQDFQQAQELREVEVSQRARQARMSASQSSQNPQLFRYEAEESGSIFGAPERDEKKEKKEEKAKEYKHKEDQL